MIKIKIKIKILKSDILSVSILAYLFRIILINYKHAINISLNATHSIIKFRLHDISFLFQLFILVENTEVVVPVDTHENNSREGDKRNRKI